MEIYNINSGHNPELLKKSRALYEYETLVELVRKHHVKPRQLGEAVKLAVAECKKRGILAEFLKLYSSEVENMIFTQWDTERRCLPPHHCRDRTGGCRGGPPDRPMLRCRVNPSEPLINLIK